MSGSDNFHTYLGSYLNGLGRATVIITFDAEAEPLAYSESFAFLENDDMIYNEFIISCDKSNVPRSIANLDLSTMVDESVCETERRLSNQLKEQYKSYLPESPLSKLIDLSPYDERAIIRLIMRNKFPEKIERIIQTTKSEKLSTFLMNHKRLPKLVYHDNL
ncbi:MAG: hypothetical protein GY861_11970 [bacterium]|nr:hypothetical protein [bacterium]